MTVAVKEKKRCFFFFFAFALQLIWLARFFFRRISYKGSCLIRAASEINSIDQTIEIPYLDRSLRVRPVPRCGYLTLIRLIDSLKEVAWGTRGRVRWVPSLDWFVFLFGRRWNGVSLFRVLAFGVVCFCSLGLVWFGLFLFVFFLVGVGIDNEPRHWLNEVEGNASGCSLPGFTGFYWDDVGFFLGFPGFFRVSMGFTRF